MTTLKQFTDRFNARDDVKLSSQADIDKLEKEFNIHLPTDYKTFLLTCGNLWTPDILTIVVDNDLDAHDVQDFWEVEAIIEDKKNDWTAQISTDLIPFGSDSMGNIFAFLTADLKKSRPTADVYFFDHDFDSVEKISDSFTHWIDEFNNL